MFDVDTFDVTIDKGTLDAMLTGIDDDDTIDKLPTNIINLIVPTSESKHLKLEKILDYQILDYARDDYHFGTKTCSRARSR